MNLLKMRLQKKRKKPAFLRQNWFRLKRLGKKWRAPKGNQNKLRRHFFGKGHLPSIGYGTPLSVRGLHPSGLREVLVANAGKLDLIKPETECARISATVGGKKKIEIIEKAKEMKIRVLNAGVTKHVKSE